MKALDWISLALIILAGAAGIVYSLGGPKGSSVTVSTPKGTYTYSLSVNRAVELPGEIGNFVMEIADGKVRIGKSPCPHQVCVRKGWCSITGDSIICIPNKVIIKIDGGGNGVDAISE
ncbi:MAG: NusG domain II-containing protein [Brevinematales bacterium]|nr:NusG domain II-containing protein [Brevinematales bacterium]